MKKKNATVTIEFEDEEKWCPTQGGSLTGYYPEYLDRADGTWKNIPISCEPKPNPMGYISVPWPSFCGGVLQTVYLYGYEQAQAMAWFHAACEAGRGNYVPEVRVQAYEINYEIKARKI